MSSREALWYFGYGSNMASAVFRGRRRMNPLASRPGLLEGFRLCFGLPVGPGERGVANLVAEPGARTWGVAHLLTPDDCDRLDRSEGVPRAYQRIAVEITVAGGEVLRAFAYRSSFHRDGRKPSARYLGLLIEGAREHGLPAEYVRLLQGFELARDERETAPSS
jgi:cation transport regulator ChaC